MRQALYRKYRPKTLAEVVGQDSVKITIGNQLASGQIGHAYLFAGPKGTGKTTVARILARSVNCLEPKNGEPCGKCAMCVAFDNNQMMDLIEIDAASNRSIDNIRELIAKIALAPSQGKYKIYVIDEAHQLTKDASNALLKTLEEPPAHAIFVLATTEPDKLLPTIISRCQRFDFRYVPMKEVEERLARIAKEEKINISKDGLEFIARQSGGGVRDAESLLEQASFIEGEITQAKLTDWLGLVDWQTVYEMTQWLTNGETKEILAKIDELYHQGYDLNRLTASWVLLVRQVLAVKLGNGSQLPVAKEQIRALTILSEALSMMRLVAILQELMGAGREMRNTAVPQVPLEIAVVRLTGQGSPSVPRDDKQEGQGSGLSPQESQPKETPVASPDVPKVDISQMNLAADELNALWPKVVEQMRRFSQTLGASLARARIDSDERGLVVKFSQRFHQEKMEQAESKALLQRALQAVGFDGPIRCMTEANVGEQAVDIQNVNEIFGGIA